ncbi:hypothetical protein [Natronoglycomyces albus]|uniref:Uncharacterized protein n=1 Tax=Natronoglycomyces albus TaxID=2811108 RepID=A0A895XLD7_9ACTN|nr:hypothetical protein [Natronoglycomyces albus]QSB05887.1 hypothetical protein JQS30_02880 [Natronoglycomyces albus]
MSDIATLASQIRHICADLPRPGLRQAVHHLETGHVALTDASRDSVEPVGLVHLATARHKLDAALSKLDCAAEALDEYLSAIGADGASAAASSVATGSASIPQSREGDGQQWWTDAVNAMCQREGKPDSSASGVSPTKAFEELAKLANGSDAAGYHRKLLDIGPQTAVRLPGLSWPMIRGLATETLGRPPTKADPPRLRDATNDAVRAILPGLDEKCAEEHLASACALAARSPKPDPEAEEQRARVKAAEAAALGPVLIAALHRRRD